MTTASAISMVVSTPCRIEGRYCAIRFGLKKVSRKAFMGGTCVHCCCRKHPCAPLSRKGGGNTPSVRRVQTSSPCQLCDEGPGPWFLRRAEDPLRRTFLDDQAVIHEDHAVGGVARKTHL